MKLNKDMVKIAFADPIKQIAELMYPDLPKHFLYGESKYRNEIIPHSFKDNAPLTVRTLLRDIGTDFGRKYNKNIWINTLKSKVNLLNCPVIISDIRFKNEYDAIKEDFYILKIFRDDAIKSDHESETEQETIKDEDFDYIIDNNISLDILEDKVKLIYQEICKK